MIFDSDVMIWFFRGNEKAARLLNREPLRMISQVTWMELVQGALNKRDLAQFKLGLRRMRMEIIPLDESIGNRAVEYLERHALKDGLMLGDALVGATAAKYGLPLATANIKHFRHLTGVVLHQFRV